jgi:ribonuclease P/MRP protein subunit RPP1
MIYFSGFFFMFDLCISHEAINEEFFPVVKENGFSAIAISQEFSSNLKTKPCSIPITKYHEKLSQVGNSQLSQFKKDNKLEIYSRLTIEMDDAAQNYSIKGNVGESYNLIAVVPRTEKLFQMACQTLEIDIISFDMGERLPFHLKVPSIKVAIKRGISFEIRYGSGLRGNAFINLDLSSRKNLIANASELVKKTNGRNIIISSDAKAILQLRGVHDVLNLCCLFGMNTEMARNSLDKNCAMAIMHGGNLSLMKLPGS